MRSLDAIGKLGRKVGHILQDLFDRPQWQFSAGRGCRTAEPFGLVFGVL